MKVKFDNKTIANIIEMADIFKVENVDGKKRVSRWGFFADQGDDTYAIYRPETTVCEIGELVIDEEPGVIEVVEKEEIYNFLDSIDEIEGIAFIELDENTKCGWYYDTIVPVNN